MASPNVAEKYRFFSWMIDVNGAFLWFLGNFSWSQCIYQVFVARLGVRVYGCDYWKPGTSSTLFFISWACCQSLHTHIFQTCDKTVNNAHIFYYNDKLFTNMFWQDESLVQLNNLRTSAQAPLVLISVKLWVKMAVMNHSYRRSSLLSSRLCKKL